jgi:hypothetical protein
VASLKTSTSTSRNGIHIELPQEWSFGRNLRSAHSPQNRVSIPGYGRVAVDVKRILVFGARCDVGVQRRR